MELKKILKHLPYQNISIRSKLMIYFLILVFIPLTIVIIFLYSRSMNIIADKINYSIERSLGMAEDNILTKFQEAVDFSNYIYQNDNFQNTLSSPLPSTEDGQYREMVAINSILSEYYSHSAVNTKFLPNVYMLNRDDYNKFSFSNFVFSSSLIEKEQWYKDMPMETEYTIVGTGKASLSSGNIDTIKIARRLYSIKEQTPVYRAILTIDINLDEFNKILAYFKPSQNSKVVLMNSQGRVLTATDKSMINKPLNEEQVFSQFTNSSSESRSFENKNTLVSYRYIKQTNWYIASISPLDEINGELKNLQNIMFIVLGVCIILVILISIYMSRNITYPIRKLVKSMTKVKNGNLDVQLNYTKNDEFMYLFTAYKSMILEIKTLIEKVRLIEVDKKDAELKALQAQINPHFLYNTLDSVNLLAMKYKIPDISDMVTSLSDFFRYSLNKGKAIITLMDEKRQVESYMTIQKIRFKDKVDFGIDFATDILDNITVKLILQPIVENAILHGIEKRKGQGFIYIKAQKHEGKITITVTDNGVGADVDELNEMLMENKGYRKSFAIKNIDSRIKQIFGNNYGLHFSNNIENGVEVPGLMVTITIPAVKSLEGYDNA